MKIITLKSLLPISAVLMLTTGSAQANLITNGGFENGLNNWSVNLTANGHNTNGVNVVPFDIDNDTTASNAVQSQVGRVSFQAPPGGVELSQIFTVVNAGTHDIFANVAAAAGAKTNFSGGVFTLSLENLSNSAFSFFRTVDFGRIVAGTTEFDTLSGSQFLSAGTHLLSISITRPYVTDGTTPRQYLDNVSVASLTPTATVAEPSSAALLMLGAAGLVANRRRKQLKLAA